MINRPAKKGAACEKYEKIDPPAGFMRFLPYGLYRHLSAFDEGRGWV
jgi:hypothetical protein